MPLEVYQWTLSGTLGGQFVQTVQHVQLDIAVSLSAFVSARNIALDFAGGGGHIEKLLDCLPSDYVATSIRVKKVGGAGGPTAIVLGSGFATTAGQRIGNISSAQANPLIIWIPATAPDKTGRLFLPGVSEDDIEDMALEATLIAACDTFITDYIATRTITGGDYSGCVWRRVAAVGDYIAHGYVSPLIGTQRRRLRPV